MSDTVEACPICERRPRWVRCLYCGEEMCLRCLEVRHDAPGTECGKRHEADQQKLNDSW